MAGDVADVTVELVGGLPSCAPFFALLLVPDALSLGHLLWVSCQSLALTVLLLACLQ